MKRTFFCLILLFAGIGYPPQVSAQLLGDMADAVVPLSPPTVENAGKKAQITFESERVAHPFNGVVLQGFSNAPVLEGWIRFEEGAGWSEWQALYLVRSSTDAAFMAAYRGDTFRQNQRFELRFSLDAAHDLELIGAGVFDNRKDADHSPLGEGSLPSFPPQFGAKGGYLIVPSVLIPRSTWGATPFRGTPIPLNRPSYNYITFHHAAGFGGVTMEEGLQQVKNIQDFHQNGRGWSDIGYQFVMDQSGRLYQGRPFLNDSVPFEDGPPLVQGAHVGGHNTGNIGVSVLGCYHPNEGSFCRDQMTPAAFDSLITMFSYLSERYNVPPDNIKGHRDFSSTACPGDNNYSMLPLIRERVRALLITGNQPLGIATLEATADEDGVVRLAWAFLENRGITRYRIERIVGDEETLLFEATDLEDGVFTDARLSLIGEVTYRLSARNAAGREQILAAVRTTLEAPASFVLSHNFPNPFSSTTSIRYFLERDGIVTLTVYDVTGREVAVLENTYHDGGRWYASTFDGEGLPSGTYFYRFQVAGFAGLDYDKTRALTLIR
ncbi:MAG: N-acetylmuramoyl-L-alanine amidase [Rhodothermales bacterium]